MSAEPVPYGDRETARIYLHPGQVHVSGTPALITTVLGSCVAVCLWDPQTSIAGVNHFLLPHTPIRGSKDARYGNAAMEALLDAMTQEGAAIERVVAKIFGGACVLHSLGATRNPIGALNTHVARETLSRRRIPVIADQTGGAHGRKLLFDVATGSAWLKEI